MQHLYLLYDGFYDRASEAAMTCITSRGEPTGLCRAAGVRGLLRRGWRINKGAQTGALILCVDLTGMRPYGRTARPDPSPFSRVGGRSE